MVRLFFYNINFLFQTKNSEGAISLAAISFKKYGLKIFISALKVLYLNVNQYKNMNRLKNAYQQFLILVFISAFAYGQKPTQSPSPQNYSKVDLNNWFDIIVFIMLPIIILFFYLLWRKQVRKRK